MVEVRDIDNTETSSSEEEQGNFTKNFQTKMESKKYFDRIKALGYVTNILKTPYIDGKQELD